MGYSKYSTVGQFPWNSWSECRTAYVGTGTIYTTTSSCSITKLEAICIQRDLVMTGSVQMGGINLNYKKVSSYTLLLLRSPIIMFPLSPPVYVS